MNLIAIDPGKSGGIACHQESSPPFRYSAIPMPDTEGEIIDFLTAKKHYGFDTCIIEEVGGYVGGKGQPGSAMFTFGRNFGFLLGVLQTLGYKVILVRPQKWQKHFSFGSKGLLKLPKLPKGSTPEQKSAHKQELKRINSVNAKLKTEWKNKLKSEAERRFSQLKVTKATADALLLLEYGLATIGKSDHD